MSHVNLPVLPTSSRDADDVRREQIACGLAERVEGTVRFTRHDRMLYATDASIYQVEPVGVVIPRTIEDVERTVRFCAEAGVPILPRGGGTSLAGQAVNTAVVIDTSPCCDAVLDVDPSAAAARVQPGAVLDHVNETLRPTGLMFGPDVATSTHATIGGMIGNNSAGAHSILYGRTVEHLRALEVMLSDGTRLRLDEGASERDPRVADLTRRAAEVVLPLAGEIRARFPRTRRHVNGYNLDLLLGQIESSTPGTFDRVNLAHLMCGSEGTLGVTLEATIGLVEAPRHKGLAIVGFAGVDDALEAVGKILPTEPAAVELLDDSIIDLARENIEHRRYVDLLPDPDGDGSGAVLYVEYFADDLAALDARFRLLDDRFDATRIRRYADAQSMNAAWKLRKAGEPLLHGRPGRRRPITFIEDLAVEPGRLPEFIRRLRGIISAHGTTAAYYAHASVGCLHVRPLVCLRDDEDVRRMEAIIEAATDLVVEFGGALSGEHGDGRLRTHLLERFYGRSICDAFGAIKTIFDPAGLMNPGNIVGGVSMVERLRVRPDDRVLPEPKADTYFRYEHEHGFAGAAELCNGAGVCRRLGAGTMCPSFRATRDERHSTRGRGNALRLAITGQLGPTADGPAWNDPETLETIDLCLSCKACKSECPSNVDMARLKAEYLAQGFRQAGRIPRRARLLGAVRQVQRAGAAVPGVANALSRSRALRPLLNRLLGVHPRRSLPAFGRSLHRWLRAHRRAVPAPDGPAVVLLPDCFTTFGEPAIGRAAILSLEALGYRVVLPDTGCCGRPLISNGLLADAVEVCAGTATALSAAMAASDAVAVVGCEPSCVSAITDDWLDLKIAAPLAMRAALAARTMLVEDFIERHRDDHPRFAPAGRVAPGPILLHGHCHQAALWGAGATADLLARLGADDVRVLDAGCCGMAGAFGFTPEHYDLSMGIGELALFPAVRAEPRAVVAAPGTSCRHQIRDALDRRAVHPIEIVAAALCEDV